jgi:methyl-accepting chemotaxis protein
MKTTIATRIGVCFGLIALACTGLSIFAYDRLQNISAESVAARTDALQIVASDKVAILSNAIASLSLEHILAATDDDKAQLEKEISDNIAASDRAVQDWGLTEMGDQARAELNAIADARKSWLQCVQEQLQLSDAHKTPEATDTFHNKADVAFDKFIDLINKSRAENLGTNDEESVAIIDQTNTTTRGLIIGVMITLIIACIAAWVMVGLTHILRSLSNTLSQGAGQVSSAARQVAGSAQSLAQGAAEQAASLEETSSSLEEMSGMTRKNADTARQANALSAETKTSADLGNLAMGKMAEAIDGIQKASSETAKIIKTIDEIAFQTNLLALNAAVEAARAGEAGKGFAVVAEEVRNLAMRSADAAKTTSLLIEGSVNSAKNGVMIAQEVGKTLAEIQKSVEKVNALISEITSASQEQSLGIGQVNEAVQRMDRVTQGNAAAAEQSAGAADELTKQSQQLHIVVRELSQLVGAARSDAGSTEDPPTPRNPTRPRSEASNSSAERDFPLRESASGDKDFSDFDVAA